MSDRNQDRRYVKRYYFKALLQMDNAGEYSNVDLESINISSGGLFFRSNHRMEINKKLNLVFTLPDWENPIEAACVIVHNLETIPGKQYFIGVKFLDFHGISQKELEDYLIDNFE